MSLFEKHITNKFCTENDKDYSIRLKNINKSFTGRAPIFRDLNLNIPKNTIYSLVGHNGAGKTTLIRVILSLINLDSGQVNVNGRTACILENDYLFDHLSASENIDVFCDYFTVNIKEKNEIMNKYIKYLGIENDLYKKVHEFSKGMKRKLSLLISILKDPDILILDELTSGVDPQSRIEIREVLKHLKHDGKTILMTSHDLSEVQKISDMVSVIKKGEIVTSINCEEISELKRYSLIIQEKNIENKIVDIISQEGIVFRNNQNIEFIIKKDIDINKIISEYCNIYDITESETDLEDIYLSITQNTISNVSYI